jgi:transcription termination factor NusB
MFAPRLAKLQFSVAMSAVFKALKPLIASGSFDSEAVEQLNLAQLVSSQHPLGEGYDLMADLDDANARFAQPLLTQYVLTDVIGNLQLIVKHLLAGPGADASDEEKEQYNGTLANLAERMYFDWLFAKQVPKNADAIEYQLTDDWDHVSQASLLHSLDRSIDAAAIQKLEDEAAKLMADYRKDLQSSIESATDEQQEAELNQMDANLLRWFSLLMGVYVVTKQRCTNANDHFSKNNFLRRVKSILRTQAIDDINAGQIANEVAIALTAVSPTAAQTAIREYVSSDEGARGATAGAAYASYVSGVQAQIKDQSDYRDQLIKVASTVNNNITNYVVTGVASSGDNMDLDQTSDDRNALGGPSSALDTVSQTLVSGLKRYRNHAYIVKVMKTMSLNNGCWLFFCYEMNIPPAVGAMLARNAKEYSTGTAIHTFSGGKTGNTYYGQCDFMLADNANQKMHFGHFTMNSKTIIHRPDLVLHAYNCYVNDYLGGNGSSFWDAMDEQDRADFNLGVAAHDIIVIPIPVNSTTSRRHVSMSGRYSSQLNASEDLQELLDYDFPTLKAAAAYWGFVDSYQSITAQHTPVANSLRNMLLFQEHQLLYRYQGKNKGDFGFAVRETGHWGETVFPGCAKIHRGQGKYLVPRGENTVTGVFAR